MSDLPGAAAAFLSALTTLPVWILLGLSVAGWAVLFVPPISDINLAPFRQQWGAWVWIEAIAFSILFIARMGEACVRAYLSHKAAIAGCRALRFVHLHQQSWWHLAKQQDDTYVSQIHMVVQVSNTSDHPIKIVKVHLTRPRADLIHAAALLPLRGGPYHAPDYHVLPHATEPATIPITVRGALATQGKHIQITVKFTDQYGEDYTLRRLKVRTNDTLESKLSTWERIQNGLKFSLAKRQETDVPKASIPWVYNPGIESVETAEAILKEEKRNYAANGRRTGGMGSLNVGLQSEPNCGATAQGKIPKLLWDLGKGTPVTSFNLDRLLALHPSLDPIAKDNLERYLLAQLDRDSTFADIAYFVFLALHRMNRTLDALTTAREFLAGDKIFGYSNLLGTLSAVISREHYDTDPNLFSLILDALAADEEHDFRLREKLNLAKLEVLDRRRAASEPSTIDRT